MANLSTPMRSGIYVFTNNEMFNAFTIMSINGDNWIVAHDRMHDFVNDGIDYSRLEHLDQRQSDLR